MLIFDRTASLIGLATLAALGLVASGPQSAYAQGYRPTSFDYPNGGVATFGFAVNYATPGFAVNVGSLTSAGFTSYNFSATSAQLGAVNAAGQIVGD